MFVFSPPVFVIEAGVLPKNPYSQNIHENKIEARNSLI